MTKHSTDLMQFNPQGIGTHTPKYVLNTHL